MAQDGSREYVGWLSRGNTHHAARAGTNGGTGSASMDAAINEIVSLFHMQWQEFEARGLADSQMDARGELDFQLVKVIIEATPRPGQYYNRISIVSCTSLRLFSPQRSCRLLAGTPRRCSKNTTLAWGMELSAQ